MIKLTSLKNPFIKSLILLREKGKFRKKMGSFLIEGYKEVNLAFKSGYKIEKILFCRSIYTQQNIENSFGKTEIIEISEEIFKKLAYRSTTEGIIAIAKGKSLTLSSLKFSNNPLILIVEAPEKPGNIGAILRTADAAKIDAVIIANPKGDLYNPNIIRSSIGCLFTTQIAVGSTPQIITFLKKHKIATYCASLQDSDPYHLQDYTIPTAFVVGTESTGLSHQWREAAYTNVIIPMQGQIDSMNLSVSAAILIFEAKRQRDFY